ncbi:DUF6850 family outer membrane beta-barrel protein [uncultured Muribaculum sp.]|nr:DUF6850 family outer membrane beta-barrel protein [uncultured Muribaculum sp.]
MPLTVLGGNCCDKASDTPTSILSRQLYSESASFRFVTSPYASCALRQFRRTFTYGTVGVGWDGSYLSEAVDPQRGSGSQYGFFSADAEVKSSTSTLWGSAGYANGIIRSVRYNETADIDIIYPYVTADETGGDMRMERYSFSGGYAGHNGRLAWGASLSYAAGLYYRDVDPRPRNTTGVLDIDAGIALRVAGDYMLGMSAAYRKYRQTCDLMFMSEISEATVYHLTGLGNHYARFTGSGYSNYYDGPRYTARLSMLPSSGIGLSLDAEVSRFTFEHVLKDLNRLPLASAWHNELALHTSWRHAGNVHSYGIKAEGRAYRRHGSENIFGDAVTGTYPQIGSLEMYADNLRSASAAIFYEHSGKRLSWSITPTLTYLYRSEIYASPYAERKTTDRIASFEASVASIYGDRWYWRLTAEADAAYGGAFSPTRFGRMSLSVSRRLRREHSLGIILGYLHADMHNGAVANGGHAILQFIF